MTGVKTNVLLENGSNFYFNKIMARSKTLRTVKVICHIFSLIIVRFWKLCTSACLILVLVYWFYGGALSFFFLMFSLLGLFYYAQDMFLYYPCQPPNARIFVEQPDRFQLPYENITVKTTDCVSLHMFFIKHNKSSPTVLMVHGNAGNIGHRLLISYYLYHQCHCNILMLEYRGYGRSSGSPSESGLYLDAETALNWLQKRDDVDKNKIFVFGSSLGGAVVIKLTADTIHMKLIAGLILENTFTSIPDIAKSLLGLQALDFLPLICFKNKFTSEYRIGKVTVPTLFLSGQNDELIPPQMMTSLYNLSGSKQKCLIPFEGGSHNDTCACPGYFEAIAQFIYETVNTSCATTTVSSTKIEIDSSTV